MPCHDLFSASTAVKAAATSHIELIVKDSDYNMKLIILDEPIVMREPPSHENKKIMQEMMMDILRVLLSLDLEEDVRIGQGVGHVKEHRSDGSHFQEGNQHDTIKTKTGKHEEHFKN